MRGCTVCCHLTGRIRVLEVTYVIFRDDAGHYVIFVTKESRKKALLSDNCSMPCLDLWAECLPVDRMPTCGQNAYLWAECPQ